MTDFRCVRCRRRYACFMNESCTDFVQQNPGLTTFSVAQGCPANKKPSSESGDFAFPSPPLTKTFFSRPAIVFRTELDHVELKQALRCLCTWWLLGEYLLSEEMHPGLL